MKLTDPIADMLTRIRNAQMAGHAKTRIPGSKMKLAIARILEDRGYVADVEYEDGKPSGWITLSIRYLPDGTPVIHGLERISRPGQRRYVKKDEIPPVLGGLGISILSTSQGVMTGEQARAASAGGELLCNVW